MEWATTAIVKYAAVANEIRLRLSIFRSNVVVVDVMLLLFIKNFTEIWMKLLAGESDEGRKFEVEM